MKKMLMFLLTLAAIAVHAAAQHKADLSRLVVVGDSLSAGFQNGSLLDTQQVHGFASLIAAQAREPLALPLIAAPGIPNVLTLISPGPPPVTARAPGTSPGRVDILTQAMDLAVPGANVQDALDTRPKLPISNLTDLILGLPGLLGGVSRTQVEWAESLRATTIIVWLGNNDALGAAIAADAGLLTPVAHFQAAFGTVMNRLQATGATLVVANIPDVTVIPFLTSAQDVARLIGLPLSVIGPVLGIGTGDFVTPDAFPLLSLMMPLPKSVVLSASDVEKIRAAINAYNNIIVAQAEAHGAALVDIHALTAHIAEDGIEVGGHRLTTGFLCGVFSLDGVHPTNTGYAIIANKFIHALNTKFAADIPPVSVEEISKSDPLVLSGAVRPACSLGHVEREDAASLRSLILSRQ